MNKWKRIICNGNYDNIMEGDRLIANVVMGLNDSSKNANLIAAAPELLEALEYATATLLECVGKGVSLEKQSIGLAIDTARKAIAKAKGE